MDEEGKGFIIRDRRGVSDEPERQDTPPAPPPPHSEAPHDPPTQPVNFLSFIYSMAMSALMCLGEPTGHGAGAEALNLSHAQELIDILTMLEAKTKGNLTSEEEALLEEMLYTLRIKFVEKAGVHKA